MKLEQEAIIKVVSVRSNFMFNIKGNRRNSANNNKVDRRYQSHQRARINLARYHNSGTLFDNKSKE